VRELAQSLLRVLGRAGENERESEGESERDGGSDHSSDESSGTNDEPRHCGKRNHISCRMTREYTEYIVKAIGVSGEIMNRDETS
jgi:hypothetical protein